MEVRRSRQLRFPPFRLDRDDACLWRGTKAVRLTPKAFAVLQCLAERHGQLVTKDFLLESLWPETVVGDAVLKVCVREIRKALGDRVGAPRFVATVHRRGYRFIAGVTDSEPRPERDGASERSPVGSGPTGGGFRYRRPNHLVRRERAVVRLQRGIEAAWRGTRQIVFVTGEPGIGKTGVVGTFLERVTVDPRVWIAHGQCVETYGAPEPYLPVLDAFGRLCREGGGDWLVTLLRKHAPTWLAQMPWLLDRTDRDALQRELLGATRERMLREMAEAVEALTAEAPLVLVLEDLHRSDTATVDLGLAARSAAGARAAAPDRHLPSGRCNWEPAPPRARQTRAAHAGVLPGALAGATERGAGRRLPEGALRGPRVSSRARARHQPANRGQSPVHGERRRGPCRARAHRHARRTVGAARGAGGGRGRRSGKPSRDDRAARAPARRG